jgi:hypothetical protein
MSTLLGMPVYVDLNEDRIKGRICKIYTNKLCCVQLEDDLGCHRLLMSDLEPAGEPAPDCSIDCTSGCS